MSLDRVHTLTVVVRATRVKETECRQRLAEAMAGEAEQRVRAEVATRRQQLADTALKALCAGATIDVARLALYRDLASAVDLALHHENQVLKERAELREIRTKELVSETRYRDGVTRRIDDVVRTNRSGIEMHEAGERLEAWLWRANWMNDHA